MPAGTASGTNAFCAGELAVAAGPQSIAMGYDADTLATSSYGTAIGAYCKATSAGACSLGEYSQAGANDGSGANATAIGYYCQATANYATALGSYCYATASGSLATGLGAAATIPGSHAHASGTSIGGQQIRFGAGCTANGAPTALTIDGASIPLEPYSVYVMRVSVVASKYDRSKVARQTRDLIVKVGIGTSAVVEDNATDPTTNTLAAAGWSLSFAMSPDWNHLLPTFNPGADTNVRVFAGFEMVNISGLYG